MIDIDNFNLEYIKNVIFYSDKDILLQKKDQNLEIQTSLNTVSVSTPDLYHVQCCQYGDKIVGIFGSEGFIFDKTGSYEKFDLKNIRLATRINVINNNLIFGSILGNLFHFIIFDLIHKKRLYQTQSLETTTLSYQVSETNIYALMGNSQILSYNIDGQQEWRRFEPHFVIPGLINYKKRIVYSCGNQIKITDGKQTESILIPTVKLNKIEDIINNKLYAICNNGKNICCFNMNSKKIEYEIKTNSIIKKMLLNNTIINNHVAPTLIFFNNTHLGIVDLRKGVLKVNHQIKGVRDICLNKDLIIVTHLGESYLYGVSPRKPLPLW